MVKQVVVPTADGHRVVKVRIGAGVRNGSRIRLPGGPDLRVRLLYRRSVLHLLAAVLVVAGLITGNGVGALLFAGVWLLLQFCRRRTRSATGVTANAWRGGGPPRASGFRYYLCSFGILYLAPIAAAIAFLVLLATYLSVFAGSLGIDQLISLQKTFEGVSRFFAENLKLSEVKVLGLLVLVYVLSCVLLASSRQGKVRVGVAKGLNLLAELYTKYSGPVAAGLATLAAFSLFGMQLGTPSQDLQLRIKISQEGYADAVKAVDKNLSQQIASGLYNKISDAFPSGYRAALGLPTVVDSSASKLYAQAEHARNAYQVSDSAVDQAVWEETSRMQKVHDLPSTVTVDNTEWRTPPGDVTPDQVKAVRSSPGTSGVEIVNEGQKRVVLQVEKLVTEQLVKLTKPITDAVPILDPLLQSFVESVDKSLQDRVEKAYNRLVAALMRSEDIGVATAREATALVAETDVTGPVSKAEPEATRLAREWQDKAATLATKGDGLTAKIDTVLTGLIEDLSGSRTKQAAEQLQKLGGDLSESHVRQLVSLMRAGGDEVTRHNAAVVVGHIESNHVAPSLRAEAKSICRCQS